MKHEPEILLLAALESALQLSENGVRHKAEEFLRFSHKTILEFPHILWNDTQVWKIAKAFVIMYHYDLLDDENSNLLLLKMAFHYANRSIELYEKNPQPEQLENYYHALETQIILLTAGADFFEESISEFYSKHIENSIQKSILSEKLARKVLLLITYNLLVKVDDAFTAFHKNKFLEDLCNQIEIENPEITEKQLAEADKINKLLINSYQSYLKTI